MCSLIVLVAHPVLLDVTCLTIWTNHTDDAWPGECEEEPSGDPESWLSKETK